MANYNKLAESVKYKKIGRRTFLAEKDNQLQLLGKGRSAFVFSVPGTGKALKVFFPEFVSVAKEEAEIYRRLTGVSYFPHLYEAGANYLVIDLIVGKTFFSCLAAGTQIRPEYIKEVDDAIKLAREKGLNPSDIHLRNIFITTDSEVKLIDVARFRQSKVCSQWNDLKTAYYKFYHHKLFPKKIPAYLLNTIAFLYKKNYLERLLSRKSPKWKGRQAG